MKIEKIIFSQYKLSVHFLMICFLFLMVGTTVFAQSTQPTPIPREKKVIHIFANQGPYGELYLPKELVAASNEFKVIQNQTRKGYFFPSIYFLISAKPNLNYVFQGRKNDQDDYEFKNLTQNLKWMRFQIKLKIFDCKGNEIKDDDSVRILGLLPDETLARVEESQVTQNVAKAGEIANAVVPFVPALAGIVGTGTNLANVLFKNVLFPPQLVANRYSFINSHQDFGWYWRSDNATNTSLLGLRRGVLLLQAKRGVKSVKLYWDLLAKWNKDVDKSIDDEYVDYANEIGEIDFTSSGTCEEPPKPNDFFTTQNYRYLTNLDGFPMLIPEDVVCDIFQVKADDCKDWITKLLADTNYKLRYFTVQRPKGIKEEGDTTVRTKETEETRLIRRDDLKTVLTDKQQKDEKDKPPGATQK